MAELDVEAVAENVESASNIGFYRGFKGSKGPVWKYFKFELDGSGQAVDVNHVVCLLCPRQLQRVAVEVVSMYYIYIYIYINTLRI